MKSITLIYSILKFIKEKNDIIYKLYKNKENMRNLIIIPTYNERLNIDKLIKSIFRQIPDISILFVDDNSPDKTGDYIETLEKKYSNIYLLKGTKKGLGIAYKRGFAYAVKNLKPKYIIQMDADLSHNPKYLKTLIKESDKYDIVIASRYIKGGSIPKNWGHIRKLISKFGNSFTKLVLKIPYKDCTSGFKIIKVSKFNLKDIDKIKSNGYLFQVELLYYFYKKHLSIKEIPIDFQDRSKGSSKLKIKDILEYFTKINSIKNKYREL